MTKYNYKHKLAPVETGHQQLPPQLVPIKEEKNNKALWTFAVDKSLIKRNDVASLIEPYSFNNNKKKKSSCYFFQLRSFIIAGYW